MRRRTGAWVRARTAAAIGGLGLVATAAWLGPAGAQVLELGPGGSVTVHDGPAVFDGRGATPISQPGAPVAAERVAAERVGAGSAPVASVASGLASADPASAAADAAAVSPDLVRAVAWRESRGRHGARSRAGATGEMQLMPGTARALGVDPTVAAQNYRGGAQYLRQLLRLYDGDLVRALAAYNAGPGAVARYGGPPPYKETQAYVAAVLERLSEDAEAGQ